MIGNVFMYWDNHSFLSKHMNHKVSLVMTRLIYIKKFERLDIIMLPVLQYWEVTTGEFRCNCAYNGKADSI